jgi:hypothetical protein
MTDIWTDVAEAFEPSQPPGEAIKTTSALYALLEDALAKPDKAGLLLASTALEKVIRRMVATHESLSEGVVRGKDEELQRAYLLGQISMAQGLASHAHSVRTDPDFASKLTSGNTGDVAHYLGDKTLDRPAIADALGLPQEAIDPILTEMITDGSVDYRTHSGRPMYFLTPPARAVLRT